jgi:hypothetical protein
VIRSGSGCSRRLTFGLGLLLLVPSVALAADAPAERIAAIVIGRDMPESLDPDTIEARLSSIVQLVRKASAPAIVYTDWGPARAAFVRHVMAEFVPNGRARMQLEFAPSADLTFAGLAAAIEARRGPPGEKLPTRSSWATSQGHVRLFTAKARGGDGEALVLELWRDP